MDTKLITVTGFFGAPIKETAQKIAEERGLPLIILDDEIEKLDGRTIRRIVMSHGEHAYRNKEYELLSKLAASEMPAVVSCGDGVLYDDDSRSIISGGELIIAGENMEIDALWENAVKCTDSYHAFMSFGTDEEKRLAFDKLIQRQKCLFEEVK